jgi:hypothetical protein
MANNSQQYLVTGVSTMTQSNTSMTVSRSEKSLPGGNRRTRRRRRRRRRIQ